MLTLTIPVAKAAKPRRVPVAGEQETQTIEPPAAGGADASPAGQPVSTAGQAPTSGQS